MSAIRSWRKARRVMDTDRPRRTEPQTRRVALIAVLVGVLVLAAPGAAAATEWKIVPSPNPVHEESTFLRGVSCLTFSHCVAVGGQLPGALAEYFDGRAWSITPTPLLPEGIASGPLDMNLQGVSCVSYGFCAAVGSHNLGETGSNCCEETLAETWNGRSWSLVPSPLGTFNDLDDVSCVSPSFCAAVGTAHNALLEQERTVLESWNGTEWSSVPSPTVPEPPCKGFCFASSAGL